MRHAMVIGVDDWVKHKGQSYGTILVDLKRGSTIDLLPDREAPSLAAWLKQKPGVELISATVPAHMLTARGNALLRQF